MITTTYEIDLTGYTVLGSDDNASQKEFTALQQVDEWEWPPIGSNKMIDQTTSIQTRRPMTTILSTNKCLTARERRLGGDDGVADSHGYGSREQDRFSP